MWLQSTKPGRDKLILFASLCDCTVFITVFWQAANSSGLGRMFSDLKIESSHKHVSPAQEVLPAPKDICGISGWANVPCASDTTGMLVSLQ